MPIWHSLAKLSFYPSLAYNVVLEKLTSRQWYSRIDNTVLLGALPFRSMTKTLVEGENVKGVVSLNEDFELRKLVNSCDDWLKLGVQTLRLSTVDYFGSPSQVFILILSLGRPQTEA